MDINYFLLFQQQKIEAILQAIISYFVNITFLLSLKLYLAFFYNYS